MQKLAPGNNPEENWGWNMSSDPCIDAWKGISCDQSMQFVKKIVLDQLNFTGVLDAASVCSAKNLAVLSLSNNNVSGILPDEVSNCTRLTHLYLHENSFTGDLPGSLSRLSNLKRLVISDNGFTGGIPDISRVSGLLTFLAQNNQFNGVIPKFEFSNLEEFNVSDNNLSGSIPDVEGHFNASSFLGNPGLCGEPLPNACSPPPPPPPAEKQGLSSKMYLMYLGYAFIGLILVCLIALKVIRNKKNKEKKEIAKKGLQTDATKDKISSSTSSESKRGGNISEYSITSVESGMASSSLVVLSSPVANGLKFEDLLRSPAELIGRGRHGSLYKVTLNSGMTLAVKRIRNWDISRDDFKKRVHRIDQVKHPHVTPVVAYYCSRQEQLLVYQFQENGSLFRLIHGSQNGQLFDWGSRLSVAARIAEALAFMHEGLQRDGIAHGNLKSSNILLNNGMEPCISEYGLAVVNNQDQSFLPPNDSFQDITSPVNNAFKADVYGFGVILLELLTGKLVQNNGFDLGQWVNTAIREEWTVEVFDKTLVSEGASEERMVNLLHIALKCINPSPEERPCMREVTVIINSIKEYEEKSLSSEA
ncbi:probable inactive receptor kinase At2g26730 [Olea europaea var. sylvestris]|uniref:probable inactive receptor kinase At2g26730 n=1 Tax=Olea europaea var. sylvestris TaxID=158386 RepID=UPI000C1CF115|nr:probable inactive receptor kinase At2g26730 [Olea europaea var. sylvestris]